MNLGKCLKPSKKDFQNWINQGVVFSKEEIDELMNIQNSLEKQTDTIITFKDRLEKLKKE